MDYIVIGLLLLAIVLLVVVLLKKPNAPMSGIFDYVAVKITKSR